MARRGPSSSGGGPVTFVDTNVLIYAHDASEPAKQLVAREALARLWDTRTGILSTQVLQEFYAVATGRSSLPMRPAHAREIVRLYSAWPVVTVDPVLILAATDLHEHRSISFWDALIVVAAQQAGADTILTEDLSDGDVIDGVRIVNPFR